MKPISMVLAATLAAASTGAFAFNCPVVMKAIDAALPKATLTPAQLVEVRKYRAEGEAMHKAGNHQASMDALAKAKTMLGI